MRLYVNIQSSVVILERNSNGTYEESYSLPMIPSIYNLDFSDDENMLVVICVDASVKVYKKSGVDFILNQVIPHSGFIWPINLSKDKKKMAVYQSFVNIIRVYENNGTQFISHQNITVTFSVEEISLSVDMMEAHGVSFMILIYYLNGVG